MDDRDYYEMSNLLDTKFTEVKQKLKELETKFDKIESQLVKIYSKIEKIK